MEMCDGRDGSNTITTELRKLLAVASIDVDETVHIANSEALNTILRL
jgi:hypothetical protein